MSYSDSALASATTPVPRAREEAKSMFSLGHP